MLDVKYVAWEIQNTCNLGCQFCYSSTWNRIRRREAIVPPSFSQVESGLNKLKRLGVAYINWTGGEPLLLEAARIQADKSRNKTKTPSLQKILAASSSGGIRNIISTNGWYSAIYWRLFFPAPPGPEELERKRENINQAFWRFLDEIDPHLYFLSLSWDGGDIESNDKVMRVHAPGGDGFRSSIFADLNRVIEKYKEDRYHFFLKVNTLVTGMNQAETKKLLNILKDVPCIWKLTQFNPRECPAEHKQRFAISKLDFYKTFHEISYLRELMKPAARCVMASRIYDGLANPYCFLVINSGGEVLLPFGEEHIWVGQLYGTHDGRTFDRQAPEAFVETVSENVFQAITKRKQVHGPADDEKYFQGLDGQQEILAAFSERNEKIAESSYNNSRFLEMEAERRIDKLSRASQQILANLPLPHISSLTDTFDAGGYEALHAGLERYFPVSPIADAPTPPRRENVPPPGDRSTRLKVLYEQKTVARLLSTSIGMIGGSFIILSGNDEEYRVTPFIHRAPRGLHFPWLMGSEAEKRQIHMGFFKRIGGGEVKKEDRIRLLLAEKVLPEREIDFVMGCLKVPLQARPGLKERIRDYLDPAVKWTGNDGVLGIAVSLILNACIERVATLLRMSMLPESDSGGMTKGAESDPLFQIFFDQESRRRNLSGIEQELNILLISAEEAAYSVQKWLPTLYEKIVSSQDDWLKEWYAEKKALWTAMADSQRTRDWRAYQRCLRDANDARDYPLACFLYADKFNENYDDFIPGRVEPIYWLYLLDPEKYPESVRSRRMDLLPHAWFSPFLEDGENNVRAFSSMYFDDVHFRSIWNSRSLWSQDMNALSLTGIHSYSQRVNAFLTPISFYNAHLELQAIIRKVFTREATKSSVAAVMMRNLSHNIGSHVLSYWKNELQDQARENDPDIVAAVTGGRGLSPLAALGLAERNFRVLDKAGALDGYIKNRMDFIAEIVTTTPAWEKPMEVDRDILRPFQDQVPLLDHIIRSDGFCYVLAPNLPCQKLFGQPTCAGCPRFAGDRDPEAGPEPFIFSLRLEAGAKFRASIPHGLIGLHALYSIIENFIRNSAKHGGAMIRKRLKEKRRPAAGASTRGGAQDGFLDISARIADEGEFFALTLSDNVGNCNDTVEAAGGTRKRVVEMLAEAIGRDRKLNYVRKDGSLIKENWGFKEMNISANFLRRRSSEALADPGRIDKRDARLPLLDLECYRDHCANGEACSRELASLALTFFLRKPKEALIVHDERGSRPIVERLLSRTDELRHAGIDLLPFDQFCEQLKIKQNTSHRFLIFSDPDLAGRIDLEAYRERLPFRILLAEDAGAKKSAGRKAPASAPPRSALDFELLLDSRIDEFMLSTHRACMQADFSSLPAMALINHDKDGDANLAFRWGMIASLSAASADTVVFDNHGKSCQKDRIAGFGRYYPFGTTIGASFNSMMSDPPADAVARERAKLELLEMALARVVIADERIYFNNREKPAPIEGFFEGDRKMGKLELLGSKMGVSVIPVLGDHLQEEAVLRDPNGGDFLIIHQGLIDKMGDKAGFLARAKKQFRHIIVDSGRGVPDKLPAGTRYLEIGALESFIADMDKYSLVQTLLALRRPQNV